MDIADRSGARRVPDPIGQRQVHGDFFLTVVLADHPHRAALGRGPEPEPGGKCHRPPVLGADPVEQVPLALSPSDDRARPNQLGGRPGPAPLGVDPEPEQLSRFVTAMEAAAKRSAELSGA